MESDLNEGDSPDARVALEIDSDDEFGGDYEDPGVLTASQISGTVVYTLDWTVRTVVDQIDSDPDDPDSEGVLVTSPPFQRRTAWTEERQSLFIESLMLGLPIPPLVLAESQISPGQFYVLDGKQRLTALKRFLKDESDPLRLAGLELLSGGLEGKTAGEARHSPEFKKYMQSLMSQPVRTIVVRNWRTPSLLHLIFSRLNKASVPLASHELRQALHPGRFTNYINDRSGASVPLLRARRLKEPDFRLRDAETLLRYIAFRTNLGSYSGDLRDFLDRVLKGGNDSFPNARKDIESLVRDMENAIDATFEIFGSTAFLRFDAERDRYLPRFNVAVFDVMCWYFADASISEQARQQASSVRRTFEELCKTNSAFASSLTSTTKTKDATLRRLALWGDALGRTLRGSALEVDDYVRPVMPIAPKS